MTRTRQDIIDRVDKLKINVYDTPTKVQYIDSLEGLISVQLLHKPFTPSADEKKETLVPAPFDEMYVYYLFAMIDQLNMEYDSYNNNMDLFNNHWDRYRKHLSHYLLQEQKTFNTYQDVIEYIDVLVENRLSNEVKIICLSEIEGIIHHKLNIPYTPGTELTKALIIPAPYQDIYIHYLSMKIGQLEKDYEIANQESIHYQLAYDEYARFLKKTIKHKPVKINYDVI